MKLPLLLTLFIFTQTSLANNIEDSGSTIQILIPAIALGTTLLYEKEPHLNGTKQFAQSLATVAITTAVLKEITHKKRPNGSNYRSFPSGHTSTAFMGASFIHERYGFKQSILPYIAATYVGYTRVHTKKHDITDVVAGAAVGILSTRYFTKTYKNLSISPYVKKNTLAIKLVSRW